MGVKLVRMVTCDRCGRNCSHYEKRIYDEVRDGPNVIEKRILRQEVYHYSEVVVKSFDNRFNSDENGRETNFVLCGECIHSLGEWLKNKSKDEA